MAKNANYVSHKKSRLKNQDGTPQLPLASALVEGEIAINFAEGVETLSIKNESGDVVTFSSDNYYSEQKLGSAFTGANSAVTVTEYIEENEEIISSALNDLETRKLDASAYTPSVELWESGTGLNSVVLKGSSGTASGDYSVAEGYYTKASGDSSHAEGWGTIASNKSEHASGQYNVSNSGSTEFGDSGNTLFSVGNGTADDARHNAFEIRQNGDIYITSGETDIRLQDYLGGGSGTVDQVIDSGTSASTNAVSTSAVFNLVKEDEEIIAQSLNDLETRKLDISAYTPTDLSDYYTKEEIDDDHKVIANAIAFLQEDKLDASAYTPSNYYTKSETSGSTEIQDALDLKADNADTLSGYGITDAYTKSETSGATEIQDALDLMASKMEVDDKLGSAFTGANSAVTVTEYIEKDELVISTALTDLDTRKLDASAYTPVNLSDYYKKSETSGKTEIQNALDLTVGKTAFDDKLGSAFTGANSAVTVTEYIEENEEIVSSALNDLETRKLDASAYTSVWSAGTGEYSVVQIGGENGGIASGDYSVAEGYMTTSSGMVSHAEGGVTIAGGQGSHAEGIQTNAFGDFGSHAEGRGTIASGESSHAEGRSTGAVGVGSHSEGEETVASGVSSHAEGNMTHAIGNTSHAEGSATFAYGDYAHTEGVTTFAYGAASHTEGYGTKTSNYYEHASGQWNVSNSATTEFGDSGNTLFSVGNGTADNARHNAFEIRQNGDIYITSGGTDIKLQDNIGKVAMPTTYSAETYTSSTITSSEPVVYALVRYTGTTALANQVCPVTLADGQQCNVIYQSANNNAYDAAISTDYVEPDGQQITLNVPAGGYAEINYINIKGIIFVRGI